MVTPVHFAHLDVQQQNLHPLILRVLEQKLSAEGYSASCTPWPRPAAQRRTSPAR